MGEYLFNINIFIPNTYKRVCKSTKRFLHHSKGHGDDPRGRFHETVDNYKIPAIILSKEYEKNGGKLYDKIASQIDFAPTILDIAGISTQLSQLWVLLC